MNPTLIKHSRAETLSDTITPCATCQKYHTQCYTTFESPMHGVSYCWPGLCIGFHHSRSASPCLISIDAQNDAVIATPPPEASETLLIRGKETT